MKNNKRQLQSDALCLATGTTAKENRGQEDPRGAGRGAAQGQGPGGGQVPGAVEEGGHRKSQGPAVLPDPTGQGLPCEWYLSHGFARHLTHTRLAVAREVVQVAWRPKKVVQVV